MSLVNTATAGAERPNAYPRDNKRPKLRVAIVTENFLPKIDGVTRTLARLLEHLNNEGHEAMVLGPETGLSQYAGHPVVGTFGVPLVVYPGLKLNFMRPRFVRRLQHFKPDVIHFVDPIWLGAQMLPTVQKWLPDVPCVSSYHTNLPTYATLFGMPWLEKTMWRLTRNLHDRCEMIFCPSDSTRRMLESKGFSNVEIWSRGVDITAFNPQARDENLRESWGCTPKPARLTQPLSPSVVAVDGTSQLLADKKALVHLAGKLGVSITPDSHKVRATANSLSFGSNGKRSPLTFSTEDDLLIQTPSMNAAGPPEFSPPPAYSLDGLPDIPLGGFSLPPPAVISIESGIDFGALQADHDSKAVVLYVGRISWEKNLRLLIEAFKLLPTPVRRSAKLVFVGDGPARGDLTRLCKKLDLDASFMGHQKGSRLAAMYASASIFAFPSFTETFGQVVLEALASGLPVVGLHAEGTSDLVSQGKTGYLLDVNAFSETPSTAKANSLTDATSAPGVGLPTPIPSVLDFKASMTVNTPWFHRCSQAYSQLLEALILDRQTRAVMGQRAVVYASRKTWWDAMDSPVRGYEHVIQQSGTKNLSDDELEALRNRQRRKAPLTGPRIKLAVALYIVLFAWFVHLLFVSK